MTKKDYCIEISKILGIDEPEVILGGTIHINWIKSMLQAFPETIIIEIDQKIRILKTISIALDLEWKPDYDTDIPNEIGKTKGSTANGEIFKNILNWLKDNPEWVDKYKNEIFDDLAEIYELAPLMIDGFDSDIDENLFDRFGINYTWLMSLKQIWKCLGENSSNINWKLGEKELCEDIIQSLNLDPFDSKKSFFESLSKHLGLSIKNLNDYKSMTEIDKISKNQALKKWSENWELMIDEQDIHTPITATTTSWSINAFASKALNGKLDTDPIYQREFVWTDSESRMLINSILLGIPLPSVILHEIIGDDGEVKYQIIDGKQRITTILRFIGGLPQGNKFMESKLPAMKIVVPGAALWGSDFLLDLILRNKSHYGDPMKKVKRFRRWKNDKQYGLITSEEKKSKSRFLPFPLGTKEFSKSDTLDKLNGLYYHEIRDMKIKMKGHTVEVLSIFESDSDYQIPVIIYDSKTTPRQIRRVFNRYNTQGKKLNAQEVNNAVYQELPAMKFILTMCRIRPDKGEEILPGLYQSSIKKESKKLEALFIQCGIKSTRYEWTKFLTIILGFLYVKIGKNKKGGHIFPSTSSLIKLFLNAEEDENRVSIANCVELSKLIGNAADSLQCSDLWQLIENHYTVYKKPGGNIWSDPAFYSFVIGAILCESSGINIQESIKNQEIYNKMENFLKNREPLGQTQAPGQWRYYAEVITNFCKVFGLTENNFIDTKNIFYDYNLLNYLSEINSLPPIDD